MITYPTLENTAIFFDTDTQTIEELIKKEYGLNFREFREQNVQRTRHTLVQVALDEALNKRTPALLIFALKNIAKWTDRVDIQNSIGQQEIKLKYSLDTPPKDVTPKEGLEVEYTEHK